MNKLNNSVSNDINGTQIITEEGIPAPNLPKCVGDYVRIKYTHHKIKKASKFTDADMVVSYLALVDDKFLRFDTNCNLIKP